MLLQDFLQKEVRAENEQITEMACLFETLELPKGYEILHPGSKSTKVYYIESGLIRGYYFKEEKDITHFFFSEGRFYSPIENIFLQTPYEFYVETLEHSIIKQLDYATIESYMDRIPKLQALMRTILTQEIKVLSQRLDSLQFQSAQERYNSLIQLNPDILLRAPLGHIASYLGITQQTLSVIRSKTA